MITQQNGSQPPRKNNIERSRDDGRRSVLFCLNGYLNRGAGEVAGETAAGFPSYIAVVLVHLFYSLSLFLLLPCRPPTFPSTYTYCLSRARCHSIPDIYRYLFASLYIILHY
ncbi:hypothetical protein H112_05070 [Trichophyton rubrum D6]|uniref:Uncharacterized protein n=2 Tax=Trichophyton TaxID=5550 RepID=A0A022W028_TRIRU|nr:hypothetical protein H100_05094 [Trichophyton rubrum MR850]EZF41068.1 hypothetical protein H102_05079 [Trichophyton rubrum CBS 100081]EZF51574.1 hypothetical protein H103_05081 [Trichophyton rubrum CBS 288.86]EZF62320.1 hypothetical protein H104_05075 [Trichophyton rubrum CBS 289.86]EZF72819.1 hypothetical protein H105_05101 [Trichophyton soudanense CBS 452.61]EZF83534.1 hypothetical protein H110_05080 [Trichophyton rubrum MR1448]EZF94183.1 hypothetical protein H113_05121 [Trichophyton rub